MKQVTLIKIFIASPGDVAEERDEIERLIWDWNNEHTESKNIVLMPIRWENNSVASYRENSSGQAVINEQIVKSSDILIAIFWSKIGTRTTSGKSGTVEEIDIFFETHGRGIGIYFVNKPIPDEFLNDRAMVLKYKEHLRNEQRGLYADYNLKDIQRFITNEVNELIKNEHGKFEKKSNNFEVDFSKINIFDDLEFDRDEQLLLIFVIEDGRKDLGARWMSGGTITQIEEWESQHNISDYLSRRYDVALRKIEEKGILYVKETTEYNNPRLFSIRKNIYQNLKKQIRSDKDEVKNIKSDFLRIEKKELKDWELPF